MKQKFSLFIILELSFFISCKQEMKVTQLNIGNYDSDFLVDYYIVSNPLTDINAMISVTNKNVDSIVSQRKDDIFKSKFYLIEYYKENLFFNRNYKPHFKWYEPYHYDDIRDGDSHFDDKYITVIITSVRNNCKVCSNMPIYMMHSKRLIYYPNGFRNDANKHWEIMKDYQVIEIYDMIPNTHTRL